MSKTYLLLFVFVLTLSRGLQGNTDFSEIKTFFQLQDTYYNSQNFREEKGVFQEEGNVLIVCDHGAEMVEWDLEFLSHATQSVEISGNCGGECFRQCLKVLDERMYLYDTFQTHILTCPHFLEVADWALIKKMEKKYPGRFHLQLSILDLKLFPELLGMDNHIKMVVVDETYFSTGGTSLEMSMTTDGLGNQQNNNKSLVGLLIPSAHRCTDIVGRGAIAKKMRLEFFKHFALWQHYGTRFKLIKDPDHFEKNAYFPVDSRERPFVEKFEFSPRRVFNVPIKMLVCGPHQKNANVITKEYENLIENAKEEIFIANLSFIPKGKIFEKLQNSALKQIPLKVITNGLYDDSPLFSSLYGWAIRTHYAPLFYGKEYHFWQESKCKNDPVCPTKIYEYHVPDVLYNAKILLIDNHLSLIGSYSLGKRSHRADYELVFVIDSPQIASDLRKVLELDIEQAEEISAAQAREWYFDAGIDFIARNQKKN